MTVKTVRNLRRISQLLFFGIFFWLILKTNFEVDLSPTEDGLIQLPYPVSIALQFDPLVALSTLLANGTVYKGLLWSLVILIPTIFLGRFFCGWVCPMGTLNHWISEIPSERLGRKGKNKIKSNRYKKYQRIKYYIFFFFIAASAVGTLQTGLLDPLPLLARSIGTVVLPTMHTASLSVLNWIFSWGIGPLSKAARIGYEVFAPIFLPFRQMHFHTILTIGLFFILILAFNRLFTRFWCRGICPLGAMLGIFSRFSLLGLKKDESSCDHCHLCLMHCQGADNPDVGSRWHQAECHLCLNCVASCPTKSLKFVFFPDQKVTKTNPAGTTAIDVTRRKVAASVVGGLALLPMFRSGDAFKVNSNPALIRPPGSVAEDDFLARCIRCGQCMRVCPNNALHPTFLESGAEGIWSPILIPRIGYCDPTCTLCGEVCPTGAIVPMTVTEKVGDEENPPNRIGTAFIDQGRCLPWAMDRPCIVCEEWCPTTPKAIELREGGQGQGLGRGRNRNENSCANLKRPVVNPDRCTGCGACEYACPVIGKAAIYILSVGESRSPDNQILLQRKGIKRHA